MIAIGELVVSSFLQVVVVGMCDFLQVVVAGYAKPMPFLDTGDVQAVTFSESNSLSE